MLKKYFKNLWTLEWKNEVPLLKKLLIMVILLSPFFLTICNLRDSHIKIV